MTEPDIFPAYWQLEYPGGLLRTEPPESETILHAPPRYIALRLVDITGMPLQRIEIPEKCRAIFYRTFGSGGTDKSLDATVFGFGKDPEYMTSGEAQGGTIWAWDHKLNRAVNVPKRYVQEGAIRHLLTSPVGV